MQDTSTNIQAQLSALRQNDEKSLRLLYQANYPSVEKYVLDNNGTADDAKDIYQEAFIIVWRNIQLEKVEFTSMDRLQGYLFRVAQHKWLDQLRSSKRKKTSSFGELEIADETPARLDVQEEEYLSNVKLHYSSLGEPCKDVLSRFYFLKQSMAEIADFFSWTEATAKNNKYRCLQKLRNMILPKNNVP